MARRRYVSTDISTDGAVNKLCQRNEWAALVYTWLIPHADDDAILRGRLEDLLLKVVPGQRWRTEADLVTALEDMQSAGLIWWERERDRIWFPANGFYKHQSYIPAAKRRDTDPPQLKALRASQFTQEISEEELRASQFTQDVKAAPGAPSAKTPLSGENAVSPSPSPSPSLIEDTSPSAVAESEFGDIPSPQDVADLWNEVCGDALPKVRELTPTRIKHIKARNARPGRDSQWWRGYFRAIRASPFLTGDSGRGWRANIDFAVRSEDSVAKVLEDSYGRANKSPPRSAQRTVRDEDMAGFIGAGDYAAIAGGADDGEVPF